MRLSGKTIIVSGAAHGIGRAYSEKLASEGAGVALLDIDAKRNEEVAACVVASSDVRETDLLEFCRTHLSGWQSPKRIFMVDEIPVNERGKISRRELAMRFGGEAEIA